jgi:hypothetical protein
MAVSVGTAISCTLRQLQEGQDAWPEFRQYPRHQTEKPKRREVPQTRETSMTNDELVAALRSSAAVPLAICTFEIRNDCPSGWDVTIVAAGANFYYDDGSSETDAPRAVNLKSGQAASFYSKKEDGCVTRIFFACTVSVPEEGTQNFTDDITDVPAGQCMISRGVSLGPKSNMPGGELRAKAISRIELDRS